MADAESTIKDVLAKIKGNIFTPGEYTPSEDPEYKKLARELPENRVFELVRDRVETDGQACIDIGIVGPNENKMRFMMTWCSDEEMITQAIHHPSNAEETVDFICRDLANASKVVANQ